LTGNEQPKSHNQALKATLQEIKAQVACAQNDVDLVNAVNLLSGFPTPVQYDNRAAHIICLPLLVISVCAAYFGSQAPEIEIMLIVGSIVGGITLIGYLWVIFSRRTSLTNLSDSIQTKTILFDNNLQEVRAGGKPLARQLGTQFQDFRRGNHSREIRRTLNGRHEGSEHSFDYQYHHFHYVNRRTETYTTTVNGKTQVRTRTVYDHFDRFYFIIPFSFARDVAIVQDRNKHRGVSWETASIAFNKAFNIYAGSEQIAAKFLTPKVVIELEKLTTIHHRVNLEFNTKGKLCLSFSNGDTIRAFRKHGLDDPAAFANEISGHASLGKLDATLDIVHTLMKYSDNNFTDYKTEETTSPWS
jgi:hypothetical protein